MTCLDFLALDPPVRAAVARALGFAYETLPCGRWRLRLLSRSERAAVPSC